MSLWRVVSLFSGGGGLDLGFSQAGFTIVYAIDSNKNAVETYKANIGNHIVCGDIMKIEASSLPKCDVIIGGPPCQSFSMAGNRKTDDVRGQLVWRYIEILDYLKPSAFLFENVQGLLSAKNSDGEKVYPLLLKAFEDVGYSLSASLLNAADYGVPQRRKRVIVVGMRKDGLAEGSKYPFPVGTYGDVSLGKKAYITVWEALNDLPRAGADDKCEIPYNKPAVTAYQQDMRMDSSGVTEHAVPKTSELDEFIIKHVKPGGNYMDLPADTPSERVRKLQKDGGRTTYYGRLHPDYPSYTVNTCFGRPHMGCNIHYSEDRLITAREALRLQSFPDKYKIVSTSKHDRNAIIGNAVPPKLAQELAGAVGMTLIGHHYSPSGFK